MEALDLLNLAEVDNELSRLRRSRLPGCLSTWICHSAEARRTASSLRKDRHSQHSRHRRQKAQTRPEQSASSRSRSECRSKEQSGTARCCSRPGYPRPCGSERSEYRRPQGSCDGTSSQPRVERRARWSETHCEPAFGLPSAICTVTVSFPPLLRVMVVWFDATSMSNEFECHLKPLMV